MKLLRNVLLLCGLLVAQEVGARRRTLSPTDAQPRAGDVLPDEYILTLSTLHPDPGNTDFAVNPNILSSLIDYVVPLAPRRLFDEMDMSDHSLRLAKARQYYESRLTDVFNPDSLPNPDTPKAWHARRSLQYGLYWANLVIKKISQLSGKTPSPGSHAAGLTGDQEAVTVSIHLFARELMWDPAIMNDNTEPHVRMYIECDDATAKTLETHPGVMHLSQNGWISVGEAFDSGNSGSLRGQTTPRNLQNRYDSLPSDCKIRELDNADVIEESTPEPWGIDRIDQRELPLDQTYHYTNVDNGEGVHAYVIDTGIRKTHVEFEDRASYGLNTVSDDPNNFDSFDCANHGTHVSGTIGGKTYGVAKKVQLIGVRVLACDGYGTWADMIEGIDWVIMDVLAQYAEDDAAGRRRRRAVSNMSIQGGRTDDITLAIGRMANAGIVPVVCAGNYNTDACTISPALATEAITVAASDITDEKAGFSDFGRCVDVVAPGVGILSSIASSDTSTAYFSGTSMSTPHVAGIVARHFTLFPNATVKEVSASVSCSATGFADNAADIDPVVDGFDVPPTYALLAYYPPGGHLNVSFPPSGGPDRKNGPIWNYDYIDGCYPPVEDGNYCTGKPCFGGCSGVGDCWDGECLCPCDRIGRNCENRIIIHELPGLEGAVLSSNDVKCLDVDNPSEHVAQTFTYASPDWWFKLEVPENTQRIRISTCHPDTNFDTVLTLTSTCPAFELVPYTIAASNDNYQAQRCTQNGGAATGSFIDLYDFSLVEFYYEDGKRYLLGNVQGAYDYTGVFRLTYEVITSDSSTPASSGLRARELTSSGGFRELQSDATPTPLPSSKAPYIPVALSCGPQYSPRPEPTPSSPAEASSSTNPKPSSSSAPSASNSPQGTTIPSTTSSATSTASSTSSMTSTSTATASTTATSSVTPSISTSSSVTPSISTTASVTPTISTSSSVTPSVSASSSNSPSSSGTPSVTPSNSITSSPGSSQSPIVPPPPTKSSSPIVSTSTPTSATALATPSVSSTQTVTATPTVTSTQTVTATPTVSSTQTATEPTAPTSTATPTVTSTQTVTGTPTVTSTQTMTSTATASGVVPTNQGTPSVTSTQTVTATPTVTGTQTVTATPTTTSSVGASATSTATATRVTQTKQATTSTPTSTLEPTSEPTLEPSASVPTAPSATSKASTTSTPVQFPTASPSPSTQTEFVFLVEMDLDLIAPEAQANDLQNRTIVSGIVDQALENVTYITSNDSSFSLTDFLPIPAPLSPNDVNGKLWIFNATELTIDELEKYNNLELFSNNASLQEGCVSYDSDGICLVDNFDSPCENVTYNATFLVQAFLVNENDGSLTKFQANSSFEETFIEKYVTLLYNSSTNDTDPINPDTGLPSSYLFDILAADLNVTQVCGAVDGDSVDSNSQDLSDVPNDKSGGGLGTGAIIGIAVGGAVVVAAAVAAVIYKYRRGRS